MNEAKIEAIKALPVPKCVADLRSILGFLAYYRHFIPGFSTLSAPLTKLLQKGQSWNWGAQQSSAYEELRRLMTEPGRALKPVDPNRELILHTDWSTYGIGAVLGQLDDEGHEYLCACASRSLNKHEKNYPPYKGELLALSWAISHVQAPFARHEVPPGHRPPTLDLADEGQRPQWSVCPLANAAPGT